MVLSIPCSMTHLMYSSCNKNLAAPKLVGRFPSDICSDYIFTSTDRLRWSSEWHPYSQLYNQCRREILPPSRCSVVRSVSRTSLTLITQDTLHWWRSLSVSWMGRVEPDTLWDCESSRSGERQAENWQIAEKLGLRRKRILQVQVQWFSMTTPLT